MASTTDEQDQPSKTEAHSSTRILLVRHAVTGTTGKVLPGRAEGLNLSADGRAQAEATAARLGELTNVAALYSSPMERTLQTAAPIATTLDLGIAVHQGLLECDFGEWTGAELSKLAKTPEWKTVQNRPSAFRFPGGESFMEMQSRMIATLQELAAEHIGKTVIAVSHADPIKAAISFASGAHLDAFQRFIISPASVSALQVVNGSFAILTVNSTGNSLEALAVS